MQQPLTVWAVSGADAKRIREERLARAGAALTKALAIGLPWPKPKQVAGRPSATKQWQNKLYASIIAGDELPDGVGLEPPAWWKRGDGLSPPEAPPAEASEALDHVDADPEPAHVEDDADPEPGHVEESPMKKRKKVTLDTRLKKIGSSVSRSCSGRDTAWTCRGRWRRRRGSVRASHRSTRTHRGAGRNYHRSPVLWAGQPSCRRHRSHC